ncbi:hypothetical protein SAMN05428949_3304 [Chitinophaga sp. YR627]|uniref:hypothetical protein n=1 Tax=Chitinophaga sp. YR627 TaxID=1881041 RepID=UPI0008EA016C|nr:hypothetical protein [Chitinophaga sp. YR627]SFN73208.1 hypothetical protein SAMN05428949_3304 [Chitinophaga sp. YR627]
MLTIKKHALKMGALALAMGITFAACSDDDDNPTPAPGRTKEYKLTKSATDATQVGTITLSENTDSSVNLAITLKASAKDIKHPFYLIGGTVAAPVTDTLTKDTLVGNGAEATKVIWNKIKTVVVNGSTRKFNFDSALKINAFAKVRYSATKDSTIAIGNILKSVAQ